jgi:hypothetical protein
MRRVPLAIVMSAALLLSATTAHAGLITYTATLSGANESPANASPGSGMAIVDIDDVANLMRVRVSFADLLAGNTAAHIHCCTAAPFTGTAPVATPTPTFPGFPTGLTSGTYDHTFDLLLASSYRAGFISDHGGTPASAEAALLSGMAAGQAYLNIHTTVFPGGEIRGFLRPVPDAGSTLLLLGMSLVGLKAWRRRQ